MELYIYLLLTATIIYLFIKLSRPEIKLKSPKIGIFGSRVLYSDESGGKLLQAERQKLRGKPDYIFENRLTGRLTPVEIKSGTLKDEQDFPYEGDLMQLAAYFLIVEEVYGKKPKKGRLIYNNKMFIVRNSRSIRRQLNDHLKNMRQMLKTGKGEAEPSFPKCRNCVSRGTVCTWYERGD